MNWEQAVSWLRDQPDQQALVGFCYFDDPLTDAAERYRESTEWQAILPLLPAGGGRALDLGAGRGISSYALAKAGWSVTALEPDPSDLVGGGAIRGLAKDSGVAIDLVSTYSEKLPFPDNHFELIHCRQALHHAHDLEQTCREIARTLKPGGVVIATREHVISKREDLARFLDGHPLHGLYGGENAYLLSDYLAAFRKAGLSVRKKFGPWSSPINYFPMTFDQWVMHITNPLRKFLSDETVGKIADWRKGPSRIIFGILAHFSNINDHAPGRLYSFIAWKDKE